MPFDRDLIAAIARAMHGRTDIEEAVLNETADRLNSFVDKLRLADEKALGPVVPAFSFDPGGAAYRTAPVAGPVVYDAVAAAPGGTGYGGRSGTTGVTRPPERPDPTAVAAGGPEFLRWSVTELAKAVAARSLSSVEVTRAYLDRIEAVDKSLNAFVTVMADQALAEAKRLDAQSSGGRLVGPMHGVPVALKDLYETAGVRTTAGSRLLTDYVPEADASSVERLKAAGAIILGKTATHEFAFGATSDSPYHGPVHNPWDLTRIPGGSSGGSAAAVSACLAPIAMGTDTGGSIRMPASCCGLVGLKPTYGRVSKAGVLPLSWSLDHVGPIARSVADAALVLAVTAGPDPADPTALPVPLEDYVAAATAPGDLKGITLGVPADWLDHGVDAEVLARFREAIDRFKSLGANVVEVQLPPAGVMTFVNRILAHSEAGAYHAPSIRDRAADYAPDVRLRLELGQYISARDYLTAQRLRAELARQVHTVMARVDAILTPTLAIPPAQIGQAMWEYPDGQREPVVEAMVRYPAPFNVTGQPAISMPMGVTHGSLPAGLQIVGRVFQEARLLRIAAAYEGVSGPVRFPF